MIIESLSSPDIDVNGSNYMDITMGVWCSNEEYFDLDKNAVVIKKFLLSIKSIMMK